MLCYKCNQEKDVRPYGENAKMVCFNCAFKTQADKRITERNFVSQLNACGNVAHIDGTNIGPFKLGGKD